MDFTIGEAERQIKALWKKYDTIDTKLDRQVENTATIAATMQGLSELFQAFSYSHERRQARLFNVVVGGMLTLITGGALTVLGFVLRMGG